MNNVHASQDNMIISMLNIESVASVAIERVCVCVCVHVVTTFCVPAKFSFFVEFLLVVLTYFHGSSSSRRE